MCLAALYTASYAYLYLHASPAANLMYFVYLKNDKPETLEDALYYFYYPVYKLHRLAGGAPHNSDRPKVIYPKDFNG